jgi:hypothetical protein
MPRPHRRPPPDHRWHGARQLVPRGKDLEPQWMAPFAAKVLPGGTRLTGAALATFTTAVKEAIELREAADPTRRDDLEAWLVCELTPAEVARKTSVETAVVAAYRDLFFDLTAWLTDPLGRWERGWVLLGDKLDRGIAEADVGAWKKYAAHTGGPVVLERLLDYLKACPLIYPSDVSGMTDADLERLRDLLIVRHWVLTMAPLTTAAQRMRIEYVWALQEGQRIWPLNPR